MTRLEGFREHRKATMSGTPRTEPSMAYSRDPSLGAEIDFGPRVFEDIHTKAPQIFSAIYTYTASVYKNAPRGFPPNLR
jgi:hypothetical protein